jgi:hypothetical protein
MKMPGFTADVSLGRAVGRYRHAADRDAVAGRGAIASQLGGRVFVGGFGGGVFGTLGDYWPCRDRCATALSACLDTCEGTWENPKPSRNCMLCDDDYRACMQGCLRDIA